MKLSFLQFIKAQRNVVPPVLVADLTGKTVLVTGANTGIGYEAAKHFAMMNPGKVIIACRSRQKGEEAAQRLKSETGFQKVELRLLDLAKFSSVLEFADAFEREEQRLDILVANAAIGRADYVTTDDGWESSLQVNVLSTLLLNIRLLPLMLKTSKTFSVEPRIVVVASGMHYWTTIEDKIVKSKEPLKTFSSKEYCTPSVMEQRYSDTKLLNLFMTRPLARILSKSHVVANNVCPGYCTSELRRELEASLLRRMMFGIMDTFVGRTAEEGARQYVWAALADNTDGRMQGAYVDNMRILETSDYSISKEGLAAEEILWADMIKVLSEVDPKVPVILQECSSFRP